METAVITGGTGAIGEALVREFSADYDVVFTYRKNEEKAVSLASETRSEAVRADISDPAFLADIRPYLKNCTLLINNAGIAKIKLLSDMTDGEISEMINTDLVGAITLTRDVSAAMVRQHRGCIINISSVWGVYGASCETVYSAAKAGIIGFTKALAKELGPSGIRVNCIAPGVIESPMNSFLGEDERRELCDATPLGRFGTPEEIAHAARFFERNRFTTGQILGVDGGFC